MTEETGPESRENAISQYPCKGCWKDTRNSGCDWRDCRAFTEWFFEAWPRICEEWKERQKNGDIACRVAGEIPETGDREIQDGRGAKENKVREPEDGSKRDRI